MVIFLFFFSTFFKNQEYEEESISPEIKINQSLGELEKFKKEIHYNTRIKRLIRNFPIRYEKFSGMVQTNGEDWRNIILQKKISIILIPDLSESGAYSIRNFITETAKSQYLPFFYKVEAGWIMIFDTRSSFPDLIQLLQKLGTVNRSFPSIQALELQIHERYINNQISTDIYKYDEESEGFGFLLFQEISSLDSKRIRVACDRISRSIKINKNYIQLISEALREALSIYPNLVSPIFFALSEIDLDSEETYQSLFQAVEKLHKKSESIPIELLEFLLDNPRPQFFPLFSEIVSGMESSSFFLLNKKEKVRELIPKNHPLTPQEKSLLNKAGISY